MSEVRYSPKNKVSKILRQTIIIVLSYILLWLFIIPVKFVDPISSSIENFSLSDIYCNILNAIVPPDTSGLITIVNMENIYKRGDLANLIAKVEMYNPKSVGIDILFKGVKDDFEGNDALIDVASKHDNIVFAVELFDYQNDSIGFGTEQHSFFCDFINVKEGVTNIPRSGLYDTTKRETPIKYKSKGRQVPSFAAQTLNSFSKRLDWQNITRNTLQTNFCSKLFRIIQPEEISSHPEWIENGIVLLGACHNEGDMHTTPIGKIPGVMLHAYGIQTLFDKSYVRTLPTYLTCILSFFASFIVYNIQSFYRRKTNGTSSLFIKYIIGSSTMIRFVTIIASMLLLFACLTVFIKTNFNIELGWCIASCAFLSTSSEMYHSFETYWKNARNAK